MSITTSTSIRRMHARRHAISLPSSPLLNARRLQNQNIAATNSSNHSNNDAIEVATIPLKPAHRSLSSPQKLMTVTNDGDVDEIKLLKNRLANIDQQPKFSSDLVTANNKDETDDDGADEVGLTVKRVRFATNRPSTSISDDDQVSLGSNPFMLFDDSLFDNSRRSSDASSNIYEEVHTCFGDDHDPFVGIMTEQGKKLACCSFKSFLKMPVGDDAEIVERNYTVFGKRLRQFGLTHDNDLRTNLYDFWCWSWGSGLEGLRDYLSDVVSHYDDDDKVQWRFDQCSVCLAEFRFVRKPPCCRKAICQLCWQQYVRTKAVNSVSVHLTGMYDLHCFGCDKFVPYSEALASLDREDINAIRPPGYTSCSVARCPVCLKVPPPVVSSDKTNQAKMLAKIRKKRGGRPVTCDRCKTVFCGICGIVNHPELSCKQLTVSDQGLLKWSKQKSAARPEFPNARRCPKCHICVTHNGGCPHMTCPCGAEFCFSCGKKYIKGLSFIFPSHTSNKLLPLVSCPKMWESTPKRIAVHSLVGFGIVVTGIPLVVALTPVVLPILGTVILVRKLKQRRH